MYYGYKVTEKMYLRIELNLFSKDDEPLFTFKKVKKFQNATIWTNKKTVLSWNKKVKEKYPNSILYLTKQ